MCETARVYQACDERKLRGELARMLNFDALDAVGVPDQQVAFAAEGDVPAMPRCQLHHPQCYMRVCVCAYACIHEAVAAKPVGFWQHQEACRGVAVAVE